MERVQISIRLRPVMHAKLKAICEREHRTVVGQIEHWIERTAAELPAVEQLDLEDKLRRTPRK